MKIEYDSNNSGGSFWLKDKDWKNLEKAGWKVEWKEERWLGTLATNAEKEFETITEALKEFEEITGQNVSDEGCNCCGPPHCFNWKDKEGNHGYCTGEGCLQYLYPNKTIPKNLREALENV